MKKRNLMPTVKNTAKSALALSLATTMVVPTGISVAAAEADDAVAVPEPIKVIDFNEGLQELYDEAEVEGTVFEITKSESVYFQKTAEEVEKGEKVDANGLVYVGDGAEARYHKNTLSNQPTTAYDEVKGTVLKIGKTQTLPAIYKTQSAAVGNAESTAALDAELPYESTNAAVSGEGVLVQKKYTASSEIVISNPFGSEELRAELKERDEYDIPDGTWKRFRGSRYQPIWEKGVTVSYWINVPSDENGEYKPSSALRWELLDQRYYQADDYAKYLGCSYFEIEKTADYMNYQEADYAAAALQESKVIYGSEYFFKYASTDGVDEEGAPLPKMYRGAEGFEGPLYDARYLQEDEAKAAGLELSWYYMYSPEFQRGYFQLPDGSVQAMMPELHGYTQNYYSQFSTLDPEEGSIIKSGLVDGELQIDVDNSIFWVPDNNVGIQDNPNHSASYGAKQGFHNGDRFFMNSWQEGEETDAAGNGTYQSAKAVALSPVTSMDEDGNTVKNGNCDSWHQVTVTLQNDWVEFYVDGVMVDVDNNYSSRGLISLDTGESFKRINKGTGLRYGYGAEKGAINFAYGNYVCRLLMDWITDEEATLHIGGAGQYANEYAQATTSCEFMIDDLKFYGELLTEEQITAAYTAEVEAMNAVPDVAAANAIDLSVVTDTSVDVENAVSTSVEKIKDKDVNVVTVAANPKQGTSTAAKIVNPFAGKELEGATIGYWVKQDATDRSAAVSFFDEEKYVYNPKDEGDDASSILYITNDGTAVFMEGYSNTAVGDKLKNTYTTATDATTAAVMLESANEWKYVTLVMNNAGIKYYVNGELVANKAEFPTGVRFLDGYYQRLTDEADILTRYGAFGGTNNQCATTLMDFITYEDTGLYLNYYPMKGGMGNTKTSGASYAAIKTVDAALTDEEVKALYDSSLEITPTVMKGDVDDDKDVDLTDAQLALKMALKIIANPTVNQTQAADVDANGLVELSDAQAILKEALRITTNWK